MSNEEKLLNLERKIKKAEEKGKAPKEGDKSLSPFRGAAYDFAGTILGSVILGVLLDGFFNTSPWILVSSISLGFAAGVLSIWKNMEKDNVSR